LFGLHVCTGMGSGIRLRLADQCFTLITLYSNTKSIRQRLSVENRVQQNKVRARMSM
jgi:hypothetical protein